MSYSLLSRRSKLSTNNKLLFYKVAIRPIFSYASPITSLAAASHIKRLQVFQNKVLRMMLDVRWDPDSQRYSTTNVEMHDIADIEPVKDHFDQLRQNFLARLQ